MSDETKHEMVKSEEVIKHEGPTLENPPVESTLRLASDQYNVGTRAKQLIHEEYNSAYNHSVIMAMIEEGRARDLDAEPKVDQIPCFIIGSGPSLDDSIEYLKDWNGGIICTTSHALTLMYHGIEPSHILALDPFSTWEEIGGVDWSKTRTKLISHPGVWPDLIRKWPNDVLLYRQNIANPGGFYATTQKHMYSKRTGGRELAEFNLAIRTEVTLFACSPPAQMFVADRLGYGRVFLAGCDFAYHSGKERFTSYTTKHAATEISAVGNAPPIELAPEWEKHEHPYVEPTEQVEQVDQRIVITENGLKTRGIHLYYKRNMISAWRLSLQDMWTTDHGAITEMMYVDAKTAVAKQGNVGKAWSAERIKKSSERYLAMMDCWVIEDETLPRQGLNFVESTFPNAEIFGFIMKARAQYICRNCQLDLMANDGADHENEKCPRCGAEPGLTRKANIDIRKNMMRIWQLQDWVARQKEK